MSNKPLPPLDVTRKTGAETFCDGSHPLSFNVLDFWQWSASDLVSNALRGRVAEFLVAQALDVANGVRAEWDAYDLRTRTGETVEVKSAAYLQTWIQRDLSKIQFDIAPTRSWSAETNVYASEVKRQADIYVFALLGHQDKSTLNPLDVSQWSFFVLRGDVLNNQLGPQKQISLSTLKRLLPIQCRFDQLAEAIATASARFGADT